MRSRAMVAGCGLRYLLNVQLRYPADERDGRGLLGVNTRAASGLYRSCRAAGVNPLAVGLALTIGEQITFGQTMIVCHEALAFDQH